MIREKQNAVSIRLPLQESPMKYGARNNFKARVKSITSDKVMSLVKFDVTSPAGLASVLTTESVEG